MKEKKIEALRLADALAYCDSSVASQATAELRSLHAENVRLRSAERTLLALGYTDNGGDLWKPPLGRAPDFNLLDSKNNRIAELEAQIAQCEPKALTDEQWQELADATELIINRPLKNEISAILQLPAE